MILDSSESVVTLFHSVGCVCKYKSTFLLLKRANKKSYPLKWGIPTGKIEKGETISKAIIRELFEETGILQSSDNFRFVDTFLIENEDMRFKYSIFTLELKYLPEIKLNSNEHIEYRWVHYKDLTNFKLIPDVKETVGIALDKKPPVQLNLFTGQVDEENNLHVLQKEMNYEISHNDFIKRYDDSKKWYAALGAPGAGKTTILKEIESINGTYQCQKYDVLDASLNFKFYLEKLFIHHDLKYFFNFQVEILHLRFWQSLYADSNSIVDESIYSPLAYTKTLFHLKWIDEYVFEAFYKNYCSYQAILPPPCKILYFYCSTETLMKRITERGRFHEKYYTFKYVEQLNIDFQEIAYLLKRNGNNVVFLNTETCSPKQMAIKICQEVLE